MSKPSWSERLWSGLRRTSKQLNDNLSGLTGKRVLSAEELDQLEDALILADMGPALAARLRGKLGESRSDSRATIASLLEEEVAQILAPVAEPITIEAFPRPQVILISGVNGSGKTTTIAKLAHLFQEQDYSVMVAAGDTFRAAAIDQLRIWAERLSIPIVAGAQGSDAAGVTFDAVKQAQASGCDVLIVDTAGRMHNKRELMDELAKIHRVLGRLNPAAPHNVILVLDATTGQNALAQCDMFRDMVGVTGLVMTKLDGTARGGILVALAERHGLPIHAIGVGEGLEDLRPFDAKEIAKIIAGGLS